MSAEAASSLKLTLAVPVSGGRAVVPICGAHPYHALGPVPCVMYSFVPFSLVHYFAVLVGKSLTEVRIIRRRVIGPTTAGNPFPNIGPGSFLSLPVMIPAIVQYLFGEVWNPRLPVRLVQSRSFGPICSGLVGVQFPFKICLCVRLPPTRIGLSRISGRCAC